MKITGLLYLSAIALCLQPALCLICYTCQSPVSSQFCTKTMNCSALDVWCFSTVFGPAGYPFRDNRTVIRGCAEQCDESDPNSLGITRPTSCCQEDLCNTRSEGPSSKVASWHTTMIGVLSAIFLYTWG